MGIEDYLPRWDEELEAHRAEVEEMGRQELTRVSEMKKRQLEDPGFVRKFFERVLQNVPAKNKKFITSVCRLYQRAANLNAKRVYNSAGKLTHYLVQPKEMEQLGYARLTALQGEPDENGICNW